MATTDPLAPFQWLNASESQADPLGVIFSVGFFRNLDPSEVVRRFSNGDDSGQESDFEELNDRMVEFLGKTVGADGGGHVGVFRAGAWSVAIEPDGWSMTDHKTLGELSRDCEVLAITHHEYAEDSLAYAIDGTIVTGYKPLDCPHLRHGSEPDRLNGFMRELGMPLDMRDDEHDCDDEYESDWEDDTDYLSAVPRAFALAAKVTGVSFTADMLDQPLLIGPIAYRYTTA
ncbi:DUF6461 domain-containing protein [Nocardia sp. NPDC050175]|uniref:DUF6461 domain-containing protein n=1 Tax=Nocardia sp. NPDC050175 TaxID=3364317 RepID=UPI003787EF78